MDYDGPEFEARLHREEAMQASRGGLGCIPHLPGRSLNAIVHRARFLKIRSTAGHKRRAIPTTPQIDEVIRRAYERKPEGRGWLPALAKSVNRPIWWLKRRATELGRCVHARFKAARWSAREDELIRIHGHKGIYSAQRRLWKEGFDRSPQAITVRRFQLNISLSHDPDFYNMAVLAACLGLTPVTVRTMIERGAIRAERRDTVGYVIKRRAVRRYIMDNVAAVDFRKVDKFWLVDLLTRSKGRSEAAEK